MSPSPDYVAGMSETRRVILELSGAGFGAGEIATILRLQRSTIKTHLKRHRRQAVRSSAPDPYRMLRLRRVRLAQLSACGGI